MKSGNLALLPSAEISAVCPLLGLEDIILLGLSWGRSRVPRDSFVLIGPLRQSCEIPQGKLRHDM